MATLTAPLDTVLGSTSKVRILRLLVSQARRTVSARELACLTTTPPRATWTSSW